MIPLLMAEKGKDQIVKKIGGNESVRRHLADLGFCAGGTISVVSELGGAIAWLFAPVGWGNWQAAVASITGLVAKENIVGTMGILYGGESTWANMAAAFTHPAGLSFLIFNLLCAPCFAAIGAIKREMNSPKWTWAAIGWQRALAYATAFAVYQIGSFVTDAGNVIGFALALVEIACFAWLLFRKAK